MDMNQTDDGFTNDVQFRGSYDYRDDRADQRGANGLDLWLILRGSKGAVCCSIGTGWMLRPIADPTWNIYSGRAPVRSDQPGVDVGTADFFPSAHYVGIHTVDPTGTNQCEFLGGAPCSTDDSYLAADTILSALISSGDGVWAELRKVYDEQFSDVENLHAMNGETK